MSKDFKISRLEIPEFKIKQEFNKSEKIHISVGIQSHMHLDNGSFYQGLKWERIKSTEMPSLNAFFKAVAALQGEVHNVRQ